MNKAEVAVEWRDNVATIVLSRPERLNALTMTMIDACFEALVELRDNDRCRVIILTGKGRGFCSGADIDEMTDVGPAAKKALLSQRIHRIPLLLEGLDKPMIAMINGPAFGAGLDMALMCDVRIAADTALLGSAYVKLGMVPGNGGTFFLPRVIGSSRALELLWTADTIDAQTANRIGLVNHCVPSDQLVPFTHELATRIAAMPAEAVSAIKRAVYQGVRSDLRTALDSISSQLAVIQETPASKEALRVFRERWRSRNTDERGTTE